MKYDITMQKHKTGIAQATGSQKFKWIEKGYKILIL